MMPRPATVLRLGLNLLLGVCLTIQATTALAMGASMALAMSATAPALEAAADLPPCHGVDAAHGKADPSSVPACCVDGGGLCQWACGSLPPLAINRIALTTVERPWVPFHADANRVLPWPVSSLLRPPIG